jgi:3-oxoacyl-[acyl-carrier protein] reductase
MKNIDKFNVGNKAEFKHVITEEDVQKFIEITGDDNPIHVDQDFSRKTSLKGIVAHGMLSVSFISTLIGKYIPGEGGLWLSQSLNFLLPVRIGDELTIRAEVLKKQVSHNILTLKTDIINQHKQLVVSGEGQVRLLEAEEDESEVPAKTQKKVILITGASRGIGAATAIRLAKDGYCVAINYNSDKSGAEETLKQIQKNGGQAMICQADVRDFDAVKKMVSRTIRKFGTITALVNNATSKMVPQGLESLEWKDIQYHIDIQLKGAFNCIMAVMDEFVKNESGVVVNMGSTSSDSAPPPKLIGYAIAKSALRSFTKSLASEFGPKGIRFNMVSPGMTDTSLISDVPEKSRLMTAMQTPLRRIAKPVDIASAVGFLLRDEAKYITGETLRVCGGQVML